MSRPNRGIQGSAGELLEFRTMPVECEGRWSVDAGATDKRGGGDLWSADGITEIRLRVASAVVLFHACPFLHVAMIALAPRAANRFMAALGGIHPRRH